MEQKDKDMQTVKPARPSAPKLPGVVNVGAHVYQIKYEKDLKDENGVELNGDTDDDNNVIRLDKHLRGTKKQEIALHEVLHTCFYGIPQWENSKMEEEFVSTLAPKLLQVIQDNPELIQFLAHKVAPRKRK